jgi:hypothetical protein
MLYLVFFFMLMLLILSLQVIFEEFKHRPSERNLVKLTVIMTFAIVLFFMEFFIIFSRFLFVRNVMADIPESKN